MVIVEKVREQDNGDDGEEKVRKQETRDAEEKGRK